MSSDFERLVSTANPAARQASGRGNASNNPPRQSLDHDNPFLIDDLDDFDDTPVTDNRYQNRQPQHAGTSAAYYANDRPAAMSNPLDDPIDTYDQSQNLTRGTSTKSKRSAHGTGQPEGWIFDVDGSPNNLSTTTVDGNGVPFQGSKMFNGTINESSEGLRVGGRPSRKKRFLDLKKNWKWPWEKEKVLVGERIIFLNDDGANADSGFVSNYVSTSKYNLVTFLPKFLFGTFRIPDVFFLAVELTVRRTILEICKPFLPVHW